MNSGLVFVAIWTGLALGAGYFVFKGFRWPKASAVIVGHESKEDDPNDGYLLVEFKLNDGELIRARLWNNDRRFPFPFAWKTGERVDVAYNPSSPSDVVWPRSTLFMILYAAFTSLALMDGYGIASAD